MNNTTHSPQAALQEMRLLMDGTVRMSTFQREGLTTPQCIEQAIGKDARGQRWTLAAVLGEAWVNNPAPRDYELMNRLLNLAPGVLLDPHTVGVVLAGSLKPSNATTSPSSAQEEAVYAALVVELGQRLRRAMQAFTPEQRLQAETVAADLIVTAVEHELRQQGSLAITGWRAGLMDWFDALSGRCVSPGNQGWPVGECAPLAQAAARLLTACIARQERVDANMQSFREFEPVEGVAWSTVLNPALQSVLEEVLVDTLSVPFPEDAPADDPRLGAGWQRSLWAVKAFGMLVTGAPEEAVVDLSSRLQPLRPALEAAIARSAAWRQCAYAGRRDIDAAVASLCSQGQAGLASLRSVDLDNAWSTSEGGTRHKPRF